LETLINFDPRQTCQRERNLNVNVNEENVRLHLRAIEKVRKLSK